MTPPGFGASTCGNDCRGYAPPSRNERFRHSFRSVKVRNPHARKDDGSGRRGETLRGGRCAGAECGCHDLVDKGEAGGDGREDRKMPGERPLLFQPNGKHGAAPRTTRNRLGCVTPRDVAIVVPPDFATKDGDQPAPTERRRAIILGAPSGRSDPAERARSCQPGSAVSSWKRRPMTQSVSSISPIARCLPMQVR